MEKIQEHYVEYKRKLLKRRILRGLFSAAFVKYLLISLLFAAVVFAAGFIITAAEPRLAFPNLSWPPAASQASNAPEYGLPAISTYSPEESNSIKNAAETKTDRVNILFAAIDDCGEQGKTDLHAYSIMLVSADFSGKRADIITIPSDSYADTGSAAGKMINSAIISADNDEGFENLKETVCRTLGGIPVSNYAAFEMEGIKKMIDLTGGIWFDVLYDTDVGGRHLNRGFQYLDGQEALDYCRAGTASVKNNGIDRQQQLITAVFKKLKKTKSMPEILNIYNTIKPQIHTDLRLEQVAAFSFFLLGTDPAKQSGLYTLRGEYIEVEDSLCYVLDHRYTRQLIRDVFGVEPKIDWAYSLGNIKYGGSGNGSIQPGG